MSKSISSENLAKEICRTIRVTRKKGDARTLSKREMLHVVSYMRIQRGTLEDMEKRIVELEKPKEAKRGKQSRTASV